MRWTERQLAMLREMGVRVWARDGGGAAGDETAEVATVDAASSSPHRRDASSTASTASTAPIAAATSLPARERDDADRSPPSIDPGGERPRPSRSTPTPQGTSPLGAAGPMAGISLAPADWLIVVEAASAGASQAAARPPGPTRPAAAMSADEERLLAAMLRAVRISFDAPTRAGRAERVGVDAGLRDRIADVLEAVRPQVVLALGRAAAEALVGADEPLGRLRGRPHALGDVGVIVTFAPSYLLRHPAEKAKAWADLCLAVRASEAVRANG
ncbi:MAG TPA: uracil-DNA glycosylase family protein [Caldimonas sp.]|nr:uracil-DNA glycosylase family protein [Caldimonas sp.]